MGDIEQQLDLQTPVKKKRQYNYYGSRKTNFKLKRRVRNEQGELVDPPKPKQVKRTKKQLEKLATYPQKNKTQDQVDLMRLKASIVTSEHHLSNGVKPFWLDYPPFDPNLECWQQVKIKYPKLYLQQQMLASNKRVKYDYDQHKIVAQKYKLCNFVQWKQFLINNNMDNDYSIRPDLMFPYQYEGVMGFWYQEPKLASYELAKQIIKQYQITSIKQYAENVDKINNNLRQQQTFKLPKHPDRCASWKKYWKGYTTFLDVKKIVPTILPYVQAKAYVHSLKLQGWNQWNEYAESDDFPDFLPKNPQHYYSYHVGVWEGIDVWLGSNILAAIEVRETNPGVWAIIHNPVDPQNILQLHTFTGGSIAAIDFCKKKNLTIKRMYQLEPEFADIVRTIITQCSSSFYGNEFVTPNYMKLQYELDSKLLWIKHQ